MCETLRAIPQMWVERYGAVPDGWWEEYGECGIQRVVPEIRELVERAARLCNVDERLLVTRMEVEQGAFTYGWDGTTSHYGGGAAGDREKLRWLCGLDKTDSGPREGAWTGPALQLLGCAARFRWLYRGQSIPSSAGLPPLPKSVGPMAPLWQLGTGRQCVAANEATAMAFRYTPHVGGNRRLRDIGVLWFPEDYGSEEGASVVKRLLIWLDPGHGTRKSDGSRDTGTADTSGLKSGLAEKDVVMAVARRAEELLTLQGHDVRLTHRKSDYSEILDYSGRGAMAAKTDYDCYISLHLDSSSNQSVSGTTVFIPKAPANSPKSTSLATALAAELRAEFLTPVSYAAARPTGVMPHWYNLGTFVGGGNNYRPGALALPEPLFMSNRGDMEVIRQPDFVDRYAVAVCRGVYRYAGLAAPSSWSGGGEPGPTEPGPVEPETPWALRVKAARAWLVGVSDWDDQEVTMDRLSVVLYEMFGQGVEQ